MASPAYEQWWERFASTGVISPVSLGMSRVQLRELFGPPDDFQSGKSIQRSKIWMYGRLEFHFDERQPETLALIYMDTADAVTVCIQQLL